MALFVIVAPPSDSDPADSNPALAKAIANTFPSNFYNIDAGQWVVAAPDMTTQNIGERLGPKGEVGTFAVFAVSNYWGFHKKDLWEWLALKSASAA